MNKLYTEKKLSDNSFIRQKKLKNRIFMAPITCWEYPIKNGQYGEQTIAHYTIRAKGGAAMIITAAHHTLYNEELSDRAAGIWSDQHITQIKLVAEECHKYQTLLMVQLTCAVKDINLLSIKELQEIQDSFILAAKRAAKAGADGVELHAAHGKTFLCNIVHSGKNKRMDRYGGNMENRGRYILEIVEGIRKETPENFLISVRIGGNIPTLVDGIKLSKILDMADIDFINVSYGAWKIDEIPANYSGDGFWYLAKEIKKNVNTSVIAVHNIFTKDDAEKVLSFGIDYVAIGRGMLVDENWANKVLSGESVIRCLNCGGIKSLEQKKCRWYTDYNQCPGLQIKNRIQGVYKNVQDY